MQIPEHWAEARVEGKVAGKKRVIRRFGWSDTSPEQAQENATRRANEAMRELQAGKPVPPREQKLPYGGLGLPIREQILAKNGDVVITRNSYGARCMNVPDVLFADIDLSFGLTWPQTLLLFGSVGSLIVTGLSLQLRGCWLPIVCFALPLMVFILRAAWLQQRNATRFRHLWLHRARERVRAWAEANAEARLALYETPAGFRVIALHRTFAPAEAASRDVLRALRSDPAYIQMCELQDCYRARVSGKPWRMNVRHIRPRPGVWPVHPDRRALRDAWVEEYEAAAAQFAACRYVEDLGTGPIDPRCAKVQRIHDELSRARTDLPLA